MMDSKIIDAQFHIVGTRYYDPFALGTFAGGGVPDRVVKAFLKAEPDNEVDAGAVAVYEECEDTPRKMGYVSCEDLPKIHVLFDQLKRETIPISICCIEPGRSTTLLAFPRDDQGLIKDIHMPPRPRGVPSASAPAPPPDAVPDNIADVPTGLLTEAYYALCRLRDGCDVRGLDTLTAALAKEMNRREMMIPPRAPAQNYNIGQVGQLAMRQATQTLNY